MNKTHLDDRIKMHIIDNDVRLWLKEVSNDAKLTCVESYVFQKIQSGQILIL